DAVACGRQLAAEDARIQVEHACYSQLGELLARHGLAGQVQGLLLDAGVSSPQLDDAGRGFGFRQDGPLDMRMDPSTGRPASDWLDTADESDIADVLRRYGEERAARRIA